MSSPIHNLEKIYQTRFDREAQKEKEILWKTLVKYFFQKYIPKDSTVIDIGAGFCEFINHIECKNKIAVDLNPDTSSYANEDVQVINEPSTDLISIADHSVDIAFASNFFEHLLDKNSLIKTLEEIHRILNAGGKLLILQPNIAVLHGAYWDFIDHYIPISHRSLEEALLLTGFKPVEVRARFLPYTTRSRLPMHPLLVRLYLIIPVAQLIFGKQAWVVGEKV